MYLSVNGVPLSACFDATCAVSWLRSSSASALSIPANGFQSVFISHQGDGSPIDTLVDSLPSDLVLLDAGAHQPAHPRHQHAVLVQAEVSPAAVNPSAAYLTAAQLLAVRQRHVPVRYARDVSCSLSLLIAVADPTNGMLAFMIDEL